MSKPLRVTVQHAQDHWVVMCKACPKRMGGRKHCATEQQCNLWWSEHVQTERHLSCKRAYDRRVTDGPTADELLLAKIFDAEPPPPPQPLTGQLIVREDRVRFRGTDDPLGEK